MILADTAPIVAILNPADSAHAACSNFLRRSAEEIVLAGPALAEIGYLLERDGLVATEASFLGRLAAGEFRVVNPELADYARAADLVQQYADFPLGTVDALVIAIAERLDITTIFTLDRRHFGAVRPRHVDTFTLVP